REEPTMPSRAFARVRTVPVALVLVLAGCAPDEAGLGPGGITASERALELSRRAGADATVVDGSSANANFGNAMTLAMKQGPVGSNAWAYLTFDVANLGGGVATATLRLFGRL